MGYTTLLLADSEVEELFAKFLAHPAYVDHRQWMREIMPPLKQHAAGNCGLLRMYLQYLLLHYQGLKRVPPAEEVMHLYFGQDLPAHLSGRVFGNNVFEPTYLSLPIRDVLVKVLCGELVMVPAERPSGSALSPDAHESDETLAIRFLIRHLVLVESGGFAKFASFFHRWYWASQMYPQRAGEAVTYDNIEHFICAVLGTFSQDSLADRRNWGNSMIKEGALQHMFWQGANSITPASVRVVAEASRRILPDQKADSSGAYTFGDAFLGRWSFH